ncbi:unnamed protein product [Blepharisma stoltei]|uniref:RING-type domain-containing protein n=1 Tax=Blepharisma stoltei TaxID=1481888 RepID=A0AAU9J115_9CILI|nr:unnamed protein product [Blepharisma stoltei]
MVWIVRLSLIGIIMIILLYDCILIMYLVIADFAKKIHRVLSCIFLATSYIANPLILLFVTKGSQPSHSFYKKTFINFPFACLITNTFLGLHPKVMKKFMDCLGIEDSRVAINSIILLYIGKICCTGLLDVFCQALILGKNISMADEFNWITQIYIMFSILTVIVLIGQSFWLCSDILLEIGTIYDAEPSLVKECLINSNVVTYQNFRKEEICNICFEEYKVKDSISEIASCNHKFHQECLKKWFNFRTNCPLCRGI